MSQAAEIRVRERQVGENAGAELADAPRFVSSASRSAWLAAARAAQHAIVTLDPAPTSRGRLFEAFEDACDAMLASLGGAPPGMGTFGSLEDRLGDRLFRANRLGKTGLTIAFGSLRPIARSGALAPEDADALRLIATFAVDRPVSLLLEEADAKLGAFRDPIPLEDFFAAPRALSVSASASSSALASPSPSAAETATSLSPAPLPPAPPVLAVPVPRPTLPDLPTPTAATAATPAAHVETPARVEPTAEHVFLPIGKARAVSTATVAPRENPWRAHATALTTARGPQPLGEFERLFAQHYVPLTTAILEGVDDPRARAAAEEFRHTFARSYAEAFPTFVVTGKRPRLVLDAPDLAGRAARLHGARTVQLLLVDAMRWDVGTLVRDALLVGLGPRATLAEEGFLLAALPSTTPRQLAGIARGIDGLRSSMLGDNEGEALRGRSSEVVRRMRVGSRDLYKLDVVDARLREADGHAAELFPEIARRVSDAIVRHAQTLPPRTLLYVFGDHGFSIDAAGAVHQGGASPEEVLVPAFSFLLGMMQ